MIKPETVCIIIIIIIIREPPSPQITLIQLVERVWELAA
jgi:hypothetical protein